MTPCRLQAGLEKAERARDDLVAELAAELASRKAEVAGQAKEEKEAKAAAERQSFESHLRKEKAKCFLLQSRLAGASEREAAAAARAQVP